MPKTIAKLDRAQLRQWEDVLATARTWAMNEAKALAEIRDRRLFRLSHQTFEEYAAQRWGIEKSQAYRLCEWATVLRNLSPKGEKPLREAHARPLYGLDPETQRQVWGEVVRRLGGQRTASEIAAIASDVLRQPKPQEVAGRNTKGCGVIVCGDAIEQVKTLAKSSIDLFLFSPPYAEQRNGHYPGIREADFPRWMASLLEAMKPTLRPQASVMIVGREHVKGGCITDAWLRARLAIREIGFKEIDTLIWSKPDAPPIGRIDRPKRSYEYVFWYSLTSSPYINTRPFTHVEQSPKLTMRRRTGSSSEWRDKQRPIFAISKQARVLDILTVPVGNNPQTGHPAPFPPMLANGLIRTYSPENGLVGDPTCGSGTTLAAAAIAGRDYWGADVLPQWAEYSRKRVAGF